MKFVLFSLLTYELFAQTSGIINITGFIPSRISLEVKSTNNNVDFENGTATHVANILEKSNVEKYTVTASSLNNGKMINGSSNVSYQISYDDSNFITLDTPKIVKQSLTFVLEHNSKLIVKPDSIPFKYGTYSDTITLTISAE